MRWNKRGNCARCHYDSSSISSWSEAGSPPLPLPVRECFNCSLSGLHWKPPPVWASVVPSVPLTWLCFGTSCRSHCSQFVTKHFLSFVPKCPYSTLAGMFGMLGWGSRYSWSPYSIKNICFLSWWSRGQPNSPQPNRKNPLLCTGQVSFLCTSYSVLAKRYVAFFLIPLEQVSNCILKWNESRKSFCKVPRFAMG